MKIKAAVIHEKGQPFSIETLELEAPRANEVLLPIVDYTLDTTSNPAVFRQAVESLKMLGTCGLIGGMVPGTEVRIEANHLLPGRTVRGIVLGGSAP